MEESPPISVTVAWHARGTHHARTSELAGYLDDVERKRLQCLRRTQDRWSYAAAHSLLRMLLSERFGGHPGQWRFVRDGRDRPAVDSTVHPDAVLPFSLSHTEGLAVCALVDVPASVLAPASVRVGVDVEMAARPVQPLKLAERFFAPEEFQLLRRIEGRRRQEIFFRLWTFKEAMAKALGVGFGIDLATLTCNLDPLEVTSAGDDALPLAGWELIELDLLDGYVSTLAVHRVVGASMELTLRPVSSFN